MSDLLKRIEEWQIKPFPCNPHMDEVAEEVDEASQLLTEAVGKIKVYEAALRHYAKRGTDGYIARKALGEEN